MRIVDEDITAEQWRQEAFLAMTEKAWGGRVEQLARLNGWKFYHTWQSIHSAPGFPDYVFVRDGEVMYVELKTEKGKLTPAQLTWRDLLVAARQEYYVWRPNMIDFVEDRFASASTLMEDVPHVCSNGCQCEPIKKARTPRENGRTPHQSRRKRRDGG